MAEMKVYESQCVLKFPYRLFAYDPKEAEKDLQRTTLGTALADLLELLLDDRVDVSRDIDLSFGEVKVTDLQVDEEAGDSSMTLADCGLET